MSVTNDVFRVAWTIAHSEFLSTWIRTQSDKSRHGPTKTSSPGVSSAMSTRAYSCGSVSTPSEFCVL